MYVTLDYMSLNPTKYTAGKTLQERALFEYSQSNADKIEFDVASVIPGYTVGVSLGTED